MNVRKTEQPKLTDEDVFNYARQKDDIRNDSERAKSSLAEAAGLAVKAIADAAASALALRSGVSADDHDLLIELKTGNKFIRDDIANLTTGITLQMAELRNSKANKIDFDLLADEIHGKREERMRALENKTANYMITMGLLMTAVAAICTIILTHILK